MKQFAELISTIEMTNKTNAKLEALVHFFQTAEDKDKLWLIALFTGKRPKRPVKTSLMKQWVLEITQLPEWLFVESYSQVGDLGETLSLLLPKPTEAKDKPLHQWMNELIDLKNKTEEEKKTYVLNAWDSLNQQERLVFNKLIGGSFRIGVSKKGLVNALAKYADKDPNQIMHSIMGLWDVHSISFEELISGDHIQYDNSKPYPFCLAYAVEGEVNELGNVGDWAAEYKWDGIRGQLIKRNGEVFIWSRGEELVTQQFPELLPALEHLPYDVVLDGEILALKDGELLSFNHLQKRLNRKRIGKKLLQDVPIGCFLYDCLEFNGEDLRQKPFTERREILNQVFAAITAKQYKQSEILNASCWEELAQLRENARNDKSEGLMLKHKDSLYHAGRKKGHWWKWKVDPFTIDAVMIYAQRGSGRRSGHYTDYTFAVRTDEGLVTIAKAYSGLTNKEIEEVSRFVRNNAIEKFGPVRTVKPELVFEIAFEGIAHSKRHKSGVALRFPRISRWRHDKTVDEIDHIDQVKKLIQE